ncbi:hypothetical protein Ddc_19908 [Ditylenchus destructor]|nr:hypothetical protein Ddc_19908 [Ditylenchus destructor]
MRTSGIRRRCLGVYFSGLRWLCQCQLAAFGRSNGGFVSANSRPSAARTVALSVPTRGLRPLEGRIWCLSGFVSANSRPSAARMEKHPYTPTAGANFLDNFCAFPNFCTLPPASNISDNNFANSEEVENSTPSTSKKHQVDEEYSNQKSPPTDQIKVIPLPWTDEWMRIENENLQKKVRELEKNLVEFQEQSQKQLNQLQFEKDQLRIQLEEYSQKHNQTVANLYSEMKLFYYKTSQDAALEIARREQNHKAIDQTSPESVPYHTDYPALSDCQPTFPPVTNQQSDISKASIEDHEGFRNLTSTNIYPGMVSLVEDERESNSTVHFHESLEEARNSDMTRTNEPITDQASDNGSTLLPELNEAQTEILSLKCAKRPNKQIESRTLTKRSRLLRTEQNLPQIQKDNSLATSIVDGQNQQQHGFGESSGKSAIDDDKSVYELESESDDETLTSKSRMSDDDMNSQAGKKSLKCTFTQCTFTASNERVLKRHMSQAHVGKTVLKCQHCNYETVRADVLTMHMFEHKNIKLKAKNSPSSATKK